MEEGGSVTLMASGNDPESDPLIYAWDLDNDGIFETPGQIVTFSAAGIDGPYTETVTMPVTDRNGFSAVDHTTVDVMNAPPVVDAGPDATINKGNIFSGSGTFVDSGDDTCTATVDYGDG